MTHFQKLLLGAFVTIFLLSGCSSNTQKIQPSDTTATEVKNVETASDKNAAPETPEAKTDKPKVKQPTETTPTANKTSENPTTQDSKTTEEQQKNEATLEVARDQGNLEKCQEITSEDLKTLCIQSILMSKAIKTKDKKYCDQMITESAKNDCYEVVTG